MNPSGRKRGLAHSRTATLAAGLVLVTVLSACTSAGTPTVAGASKETLTLGVSLPPVSYKLEDLGPGGPLAQEWQPVFDTLLRFGNDGTIAPNAASAFEFNDAKTLLTLTIRDGMTFTDGHPVDAAAVKACLERGRDSAGPAALNLAGAVVDAPDTHTVTIKLPQPNALLPQFLASSTGALVSPASFSAADAATNPVGSGPYRIDPAATTSGSTYTFVRNGDYWNAKAFPYDSIVFKVLEDPTATLSALLSGQIDGAELNTQTAPAAKSAGLDVLGSTTSWSGLVIADRGGKLAPALRDVRVRQAINMVFDRPAIVKNLFQGAATETEQIFNPASELYDPGLNTRYAFDVDAAKRLMADAGYSTGFELHMPDIPGLSDGLPLVIQQLAKLNIRVTPDTETAQQGFPDMMSGKWAMIYMGVAANTPLGDAYNATSPMSFINPFHTVDPEISALMKTALGGTADESAAALKELNKQLTEKAWFAPLANATSNYAVGKGISATKVIGDNSVPIWNFVPKQ